MLQDRATCQVGHPAAASCSHQGRACSLLQARSTCEAAQASEGFFGAQLLL